MNTFSKLTLLVISILALPSCNITGDEINQANSICEDHKGVYMIPDTRPTIMRVSCRDGYEGVIYR